MKASMIFGMFLFAMGNIANASLIDQTGNLLNNGSFESGSTDPVTGDNIDSAADNWRQWVNGGTSVTSELITNNEMLSTFGEEVIDGDKAFRITTNGSSSGGYTFEQYHNPGWNTNTELTFSAWIYTISGTAGVWNGSNFPGTFFTTQSTTTGNWEFLSVTVNPTDLVNGLINEPLLYSVGGAADFIVDSAWLNYGATVENPSAPVPEPSILALMGLGIFGLGLSRRKMKK